MAALQIKISVYISSLSKSELNLTFRSFAEPIAFVGHTHMLNLYEDSGTSIKSVQLKKEKYFLSQDHRYIINAGSVGQPRDGNNAAKYVIYDTGELSLEVRYVDYDINKTAQLLKELGFPENNRRRLFLGI